MQKTEPPFLDLRNKSGFFDLLKQDICKDLEHNPPQYFYIPQGKGYKHVCPSCKKETIIKPLQITN